MVVFNAPQTQPNRTVLYRTAGNELLDSQSFSFLTHYCNIISTQVRGTNRSTQQLKSSSLPRASVVALLLHLSVLPSHSGISEGRGRRESSLNISMGMSASCQW